MELSKANSGNITAHITQIDAAESINQALGEFSDKLDSAQLEPVFQQPEQPVRDTVKGFTAVIFQHEIDHLDGVLYIDRL